jgi:hypothetical protein
LGIAHSAEPQNPLLRRLADAVEAVAWRLPWLSMGCRSVDVLGALQNAGGKVLLTRHFGVPLWPFLLIIVEKPAG